MEFICTAASVRDCSEDIVFTSLLISLGSHALHWRSPHLHYFFNVNVATLTAGRGSWQLHQHHVVTFLVMSRRNLQVDRLADEILQISKAR